jgi:hypothetical protein
MATARRAAPGVAWLGVVRVQAAIRAAGWRTSSAAVGAALRCLVRVGLGVTTITMLTRVTTGSGAFRAVGERSFLHKKDGFTGKYVVQQRLKTIFCFSWFLSDSYSSWYVNAQI